MLLTWAAAAPLLILPLARPGRAANDTDGGAKLVAAARAQVGVTLVYDPAYARLDYPNGDIDRRRGVCADVIVRAYRDALGLDLQALLHRDMKAAFAAYPSQGAWGLARPDRNIDHRRVLNLEAFLKRQGGRLWQNDGDTGDGAAFPEPLMAGDLLTWRLGDRLPHVAVVGEAGDAPTVIHNIGWGAREEPLVRLSPHRPAGHYRWFG
jgi:uncharacterized protein YijF (DUF1287 family)